jgi:hypothetical protein
MYLKSCIPKCIGKIMYLKKIKTSCIAFFRKERIIIIIKNLFGSITIFALWSTTKVYSILIRGLVGYYERIDSYIKFSLK